MKSLTNVRKIFLGSHCQDINVLKSREDPEWLVIQRKKENEIIESWISTYKRDLNISI